MGGRDLYRVICDTTRLIGSLFPVLMIAVCLNLFLAYQKIPADLLAWLSGYLDTKFSFLLFTNLLLLAVGSVMDIGSAILILSPLLKPLAVMQGIDPVHFGIIMIVNLEIGYLTPPLGLNLIVAMGAFREGFWEICKAAVPFILLLLLGLVIVSLVPALSLFLR
jgi:C4-dicarboxylate transporter DctM subunit